jgi:signal peptidase I
VIIEAMPKRKEGLEHMKQNKKFLKLNRSELLEILVEQNKEIDALKRNQNQKEGSSSGRDALRIAREKRLESELKKKLYGKRYRRTFRSTVYALITVAAVAVLVATLWLPVLQIYGSSMTPTLKSGQLVLSLKSNNVKTGDIIAFYYNNKILVKRVIATSGDWVDVSDDGTVYVNGEELDEPYVKEKALGDCNITFPYQVPDSRYFVMGDHRSTSVDSRNTAVGCVSEEQVVGHLVFRIWPLEKFGTIE